MLVEVFCSSVSPRETIGGYFVLFLIGNTWSRYEFLRAFLSNKRWLLTCLLTGPCSWRTFHDVLIKGSRVDLFFLMDRVWPYSGQRSQASKRLVPAPYACRPARGALESYTIKQWHGVYGLSSLLSLPNETFSKASLDYSSFVQVESWKDPESADCFLGGGGPWDSTKACKTQLTAGGT